MIYGDILIEKPHIKRRTPITSKTSTGVSLHGHLSNSWALVPTLKYYDITQPFRITNTVGLSFYWMTVQLTYMQ